MEGERGVIIALQGDPSTGKTTIANILGRALKCTTFNLDDVLNFLAPGPKPPRSTKVDALFTKAFDLLTRLIKTQTRLGMSVVVDSPLSRRSHLDKLVGLITGEAPAALRLLIIHCIPETKYMWETELSSHIGSRYKHKWYKPQTFPIDKAFIRDYKNNEIPAQLVSRLVVQTSSHVDILPSDPLVVLVRRMITSRQVQNKNLNNWMRYHGISPPNYKRPRKWNLDDESSTDEERPRKKMKALRELCTEGHCVKEYHKKGAYRILSGVCEACDEKIIDSEAVYSCTDCPMAIHEACAELGVETEYNPEDFPKFLHRKLYKATYCFPEQHSCSVCKKEGKEFSYNCGSCVFKSHLKSRKLPTILHHKGHPQHRLYFWVRPVSMDDCFECYACRKLTNFVGFSCTEGCTNYHPECAFLPQVFKMHCHGGHEHDLNLVFNRKVKMEDYICNACNETLNPDAWFYACHKCEIEMHLDCAFEEFK